MTNIEQLLRAGPDGASRTGHDAQIATDGLLVHAQQHGLIDVSYAQIASPLGDLLIAATDRGLVRLAFPEQNTDEVLDGLAQRISPRLLEAPRALDAIRRELEEYFNGARRVFELKLDWKLIEGFARNVLSATSAIPYGGVSTYGAVAADAGSPRGFRAAGNALGSNPIPIVIPCHRVLRSGGELGGYTGGTERKHWLLAHEGALPAETSA
jgi:methylated-DNA-[protein]-cysteine S-methyltransferase